MNTECERELLSLQLVAATARAFFALLNNWSILCPFVTSSVYIRGNKILRKEFYLSLHLLGTYMMGHLFRAMQPITLRVSASTMNLP